MLKTNFLITLTLRQKLNAYRYKRYKLGNKFLQATTKKRRAKESCKLKLMHAHTHTRSLSHPTS
jgi:hypothetical protein